MHRHNTPLRGVKATPHPKEGDPHYTAVNYRYAGQTGHIHEVVEIEGRELVKVGFDKDLVSDAIGDEDFISEAEEWKPSADRAASAEARMWRRVTMEFSP